MRFLASILALLFLQLSLLPGEMCTSDGADMTVCESTCTNACNDTPAKHASEPNEDCHCNPLQACGQCALPMPLPVFVWNAIVSDPSTTAVVVIQPAPHDVAIDFWQPPKLV